MAGSRRGNTPEGNRQALGRYRATIAGRITQLTGAARRRSRLKGLPFTLTDEWVRSRLEAGHCEVTGFPFTLGTLKGREPYSPSIDRINNDVGYTPENCRLVISAFNVGRNVWSDDVLAGWARAFLRAYDSAH